MTPAWVAFGLFWVLQDWIWSNVVDRIGRGACQSPRLAVQTPKPPRVVLEASKGALLPTTRCHLHSPFQIPAGSLIFFCHLSLFLSRFISDTLVVLSFRPCLFLALLFFSLLDARFLPFGWCQPCDLVLEFCLGSSENHAGLLAFEGHRVALFLFVSFHSFQVDPRPPSETLTVFTF